VLGKELAPDQEDLALHELGSYANSSARSTGGNKPDTESAEHGLPRTDRFHRKGGKCRVPLSGPGSVLVPTPKRPAMRLLLVSDLHYTLRQFDWVVGAAPAFDVIAVAGDHLDIAATTSLSAQTIVIREYLRLLGDVATVVVSSGNHDLIGPDSHGEQAATWLAAVRATNVVTDCDSLNMGETLITVCPWWDGPIGRDAVAAQLAGDAHRRPANWIWIYHWPPTGSPTCWTGKRHYGDDELVGWINEHQPDAVLCGHVHQPPFRSDGSWADRIGRTWVFNAGTQIGPVPARIEIDFDRREAVWISSLGSETLSLDDLTAPVRTVF
jgi:Icc-related predicted phosphoesterase